MEAIIGITFGIVVSFIVDRVSYKKHGYPFLSILSAKCYQSKYFKWLVWNVWGNDDWYYQSIIKYVKVSKELKEKKKRKNLTS